MPNMIIFEKPLNEYIRICLRVENLIQRIEWNIAKDSEASSQYTLEAMLEILNVVDRPDLKSKITNALSQCSLLLNKLSQKAHVDKERLARTIVALDRLVDAFYHYPDKIGQVLRDNHFLNNIRQHMANPGGACPFTTSAYHLWLRQSPCVRKKDLQQWFTHLSYLKEAVDWLLFLIRDSMRCKTIHAKCGFYQVALDSKISYHLVRVEVPEARCIYPEISVNRHRLIVRFFSLNTADRPLEFGQDIDFKLTCCLPMGVS